jgi:uncharacterized membrane protein
VDSTPDPAAPGAPADPPSAAAAPSGITPPGPSGALLSPLRVLAALCVIVPIVAVLWVPWFNRMTPEVLGFPFFYWYQLLWVVLTAVLMIVAYHAIRRDEAARRGRTGAGR